MYIGPDSSTAGCRVRSGTGGGAGVAAGAGAWAGTDTPGGALGVSPASGAGRLVPGTQAEPFQYRM
jgi:hypothetical protein